MPVRSVWLPTLVLAALALLLAACTQAPVSAALGTAQATPGPALVTPPTGAPDGGQIAGGGTAETKAGLEGTVWVANGQEDNLSVVDPVTGKTMTTLPAGTNPHILSLSPDGHIVYLVNAGGHDRQPGAHEEAAKAEQPSASVQEATPDVHHGDAGSTGTAQPPTPTPGQGDDQNAGQDTGGYSLWAIEAASGKVLARVAVGQGPTHPLPSPDGRWVYVTNTEEGSVSVVDTATWQVVATIPGLAEPHDGEVTPDSRLLYLATAGDSTMTVVDTAQRKVIKTFKVGAKPRGLALAGANGEIAYVSNKGDGTLSVIDVAAGQVKATFPVGQGAHGVRVSPDGNAVYAALSQEDAVAVVDVGARQVRAKIPVGKTPEQIDLSRDGRWLYASNNGESTLSIVDLAQGKVVATVPVGKGADGVQALAAPLGPRATIQASSTLPVFPRNADGFADITVQQLADLLASKNFTFVNVHIPYEGELPQTDLFIPYDQVKTHLDELPGKDAPIVLYCRSGSMSTQAARTLVQLGYTNVMELDGGFNAWKAAGYELLKKR